MIYTALYAKLDAANAAIQAAAETMKATPTDATICAYEAALDAARDVRRAIGDANAADMREREIAASICTGFGQVVCEEIEIELEKL